MSFLIQVYASAMSFGLRNIRGGVVQFSLRKTMSLTLVLRMLYLYACRNLVSFLNADAKL
jgi:hypothetical protein